MSKTGFNLQAPQFSDSDGETPMDKVLDSYNKEYSLIYQQIKSFLKQCKQNINKYIQFNQFGARFNMYALYAQMTTIETSTLNGLSDVSKQQLEHQKSLKVSYQKEFENILERMENVIKDFLKFQIDFKRQYFGWNLKQPEFSAVKKKNISQVKSPVLGKLSSQHSINSGSSIRHRPPSISLEDQKKQTQLQQKLRQILKRKLAPQKQNIIKFCDRESDPFKNMLKLQQKIDMMQSEIILSKTREEKIIDIFNKRRIENIQPKGENIVHCELIETDDGNGKRIVNASKSRGKLNNDLNENHVKNNSMSLNKSKVFSKLSLDINAINVKNLPNEQISPSKLNNPNDQKTPRKLISPKGMKSPSSSNPHVLNFFGSPKNLLTKKLQSKSPPIDFKKKRQLEWMQQNPTQQSIQNSMLNQKQKQKKMQSIPKQNHSNQKEDLDGGALNSSIHKNRQQFLMRRRSNNSPFHIGGSSWID